MCWNAEVSLIFSLGLFAATAWLVFQGRKASKGLPTRYSPAAKWHALIVGNIACVEASEVRAPEFPEDAGRRRERRKWVSSLCGCRLCGGVCVWVSVCGCLCVGVCAVVLVAGVDLYE